MPGVEKTKQEKLENEARTEELKEQQKKAELQQREEFNSLMLDACLADAYSSYKANWANSCKSVAQSKANGYQNCVNTGLDASSCRSIWDTPDYSGDCSLPTETAKRWDDFHSDAKQECYNKYR